MKTKNYKKIFDEAYNMMPTVFSSELFNSALNKIDSSVSIKPYFRFSYLVDKAPSRITKRTWSKKKIMENTKVNITKEVKNIEI